jgi:D-alanine transaminase
MNELAYINGDVVPVDDATVSVRDRGFVFGDGVYDVARVYGGVANRLDRHIERLRRNANELEFASVPAAGQLHEIIDELLERSGLVEAMVYMQLTRGVARRKSAFPEGVGPTVYVSVEEIRRGADALREDGASAILVDDIRWDRNDIKTVNLLPKVMMGERAKRAGAYEALYVDGDGHAWEGTSTNLFAVIDGGLVTPPLGPRVLPGTTRADVLELASDLGIPCRERPITAREVVEAEELFLTGTLTEVLGIVSVGGIEIGDGAVGATTQAMSESYRKRVRD